MFKRFRLWFYKFAEAYAREKWLDAEQKYLSRVKELETENHGLRKYIQGVHVGLTRGRRDQ